MALRLVAGTAALAVAAAGAVLTVPSSSEGAAPPPSRAGAAGAKSTWTEADKAGFGTARSTQSNVWFTLQGGRMSEVFYPDLSTPSVRSLELVVTDGQTFTDRTSTDTITTTSRPDPRSLRFTQVNTDEDGLYKITEQYVADPRRDSVVVHLRLKSLDGGKYRLYALYDPALSNDGMDDRGRSGGHGLVARDGTTASVLLSQRRLRSRSTGLVGTASDPWRDLAADGDVDRPRDHAGPGNIAQLGRLAGITGRGGHQRATLALGFGRTTQQAWRQARSSAAAGWDVLQRRYDRGWHGYLDELKDVPASAADVREEYLASVLVVAAAEDKLHRGAFVASPSAPWVWGDEVPDLSSPSGAYHLVWSRDAYQFGTALWAAGDRAAARRIVDWLFGTQQKKDGSFPQNSDVGGTPVWGELQLDEVALPIVLAHLVGKDDTRTWRGVRKAAGFLAGFRDEETGRRAPYSPQERWENQSGYSPNSIAAQIAGLVTAADLARTKGHHRLARRWLALADTWQRKVEDWTVTTNGPLADTPYFLRLTKNGRPNTKSPYEMGDGGPRSVDQRKVVDPSFLDLVRYGIEAPDDPAVVSTLEVIDRRLEVSTPNGSFWRRFSFDGYGETRSGGEWVITEPGDHKTLGRGWPILTGERGEYAVTAGRDGTPYLAAMAAAAGPAGMLAEQVWDGRPPTGKPCCEAGEGTRSATPLTWSHAQLVRLAWTIQRGRPVDRQAVVANRYTG
jgi:glucoamylase